VLKGIKKHKKLREEIKTPHLEPSKYGLVIYDIQQQYTNYKSNGFEVEDMRRL